MSTTSTSGVSSSRTVRTTGLLVRLASLLAVVLGLLVSTAGTSSAVMSRDLPVKTYGGCTITAKTPYTGSDMRGHADVTIRCSSTQTIRAASRQVLNEVPNGGDTGYTGAFAMTGTLQAGITYTWSLSWAYNMYHSYPWYTRASVSMQSWGGATVRVESGSCGC